MQFHGLAFSVVGCVDRSVNRNFLRSWIGATAREGLYGKVGVRSQIVDRALPRGIGFAAERSRQCGSGDLLTAGRTLQFPKRNSTQCGLHTRFRRPIRCSFSRQQ